MNRCVPSIGKSQPALLLPTLARTLISALTAWTIAMLVPAAVLGGSSPLFPPSKKEAGALKLVQVMGIANRSEIVGIKEAHQQLLDSGLADSLLVDRSLGWGRVYCCGGLPASTHLDALEFYVPPGIAVEPGDIVELRLGQAPHKGSPGRINVLAQVRDPAYATEHHCRWEPPDERDWMRVIYCDWMPGEGWTHKKGIGNPWIKPAGRDSLP